MRKKKSPILEAVRETVAGLRRAGAATDMADYWSQRWSPELRRALMKVRPEFFTWPVAERERYGVNIPDSERAQIEHILFNALSLFKRKVRSPKAAAQAINRLSLAQLNPWNEVRLPLMGIGDDCFYLNEYFGDNTSILDFDTLRAYDEDNHRFQEDARQARGYGLCRPPLPRSALFHLGAIVCRRAVHLRHAIHGGRLYLRATQQRGL